MEAPVPEVSPVKTPVLSLVQAKVVPATPLGFEIVMVLMAVPEQTVCAAGVADIAGIGFTVIVNVLAGPVHPFAVAVTDTVATIGALVELLAVNAEMSPVPLVPKPTSALLVHANVAPGTLLLKLIAAPAAVLQYTALLTAFTAGSGFTVIV